MAFFIPIGLVNAENPSHAELWSVQVDMPRGELVVRHQRVSADLTLDEEAFFRAARTKAATIALHDAEYRVHIILDHLEEHGWDATLVEKTAAGSRYRIARRGGVG